MARIKGNGHPDQASADTKAMTAPKDYQRGLVRYLGDVDLLAELLACDSEGFGTGTPWSWYLSVKNGAYWKSLRGKVNLPKGKSYASLVADDAWRLANWLELVDSGRLTRAGRDIASVAGYPREKRNSSVNWPLETALRQQIRNCYLGNRGLRLADLVEEGSSAVQKIQDGALGDFPDLLLIEFGALLFTGTEDAGMAKNLVRQLVQHRRAALRSAPQARLVKNVMERDLSHIRAVSKYYFEEMPHYWDKRVLTPLAVTSIAPFFKSCDFISASYFNESLGL